MGISYEAPRGYPTFPYGKVISLFFFRSSLSEKRVAQRELREFSVTEQKKAPSKSRRNGSSYFSSLKKKKKKKKGKNSRETETFFFICWLLKREREREREREWGERRRRRIERGGSLRLVQLLIALPRCPNSRSTKQTPRVSCLLFR